MSKLTTNQLAVPQAAQRTNPTFFFEYRCSEPGVESMVNSSVDGIGSRYVGCDMGGVAVRRGVDRSVSEDEGGSVSGDMLFEMSSQACVGARSGVSCVEVKWR